MDKAERMVRCIAGATFLLLISGILSSIMYSRLYPEMPVPAWVNWNMLAVAIGIVAMIVAMTIEEKTRTSQRL